MTLTSQYLSGTTLETNVELKDVREKQMLTRSGYLRAHGGYIPLAAFRERRHFFAAKVLLSDAVLTCCLQL